MERDPEQIHTPILSYLAVSKRAAWWHVKHGTILAVVENGECFDWITAGIHNRKLSSFFLSQYKHSIDPIHSQDFERYTFERLQLTTHLPDRSTLSIMPNTINAALLPLTTSEFTFTEKEYET